MEYQENYEVDGDGFEVPDTPHMEIMFDALEHTAEIEGTESLQRFNNLTEQQHYAAAVLAGVGIRLGNGRRDGMEGVFSAIGDGFKAVWDYIKKTFNAIWDFFFSRDSKKEADEASEKIEEANKDLKAAENGTLSDEEAAKVANKMANVADGATAEELKKAKTPAERKKAIKAALAKLPSMNKAGQTKFVNTIKAAVNAKIALAKSMEEGGSNKEKAAANKLSDSNHPAMQMLLDMANEVTKFSLKDAAFLKQMQTLEKAATFTPAQAIAFGEAAKKNVEAVQDLSKGFDVRKGKIQGIITQTEAKMKKAKNAGDKKELQSEIGALRTMMVSATRTSKLISANFTRVSAAHQHLVQVFCL